jgi:hypothetical protein
VKLYTKFSVKRYMLSACGIGYERCAVEINGIRMSGKLISGSGNVMTK